AKRLQVALEHLVKNKSDLKKQKAQYLLDVFETMSVYALLTLWCSLDPVVRVPMYHLTLQRSLDPIVVCFAKDRDGYTTSYPNSPIVNNLENGLKPKRWAKTDDKSYTSSARTSDDMYKSVDDELEKSEKSDEKDELRLDMKEIGFKEYIDQGDKHMDNYSETQVKTFSREMLKDLREDIKSKLIRKEKETRGVKSILQEYIEVANDGRLHELYETITESYTIPLYLLKEIMSKKTLVANIISLVLRIFFHNLYIYPTIWLNTSSTSAKIQKLAINDPFWAKQPDMIRKIVNNGKIIFETMFREVTGKSKNNTEKKNLIDLIRLGLFMKDALDNILPKTSVNQIFAWQVIVIKWTGYMMTLISPGIYVIDTDDN
ncbi:1867_t:CDS:10, partial [Funneliformis caledonium]